MNQSQFLAITCNSLEARKKSRVRGAIGFSFASHWLEHWRVAIASRNYFRQSFENCSNIWVIASVNQPVQGFNKPTGRSDN